MTASSYDGRKPEPPYHTDSDVVVNLQEQIDALTEERDELRTELQRLQSSPAPDGQPILAEAFADNGAHSHWYLIDPKTGAKVWSEDPEECAARGFAASSPAPVVGGVPELTEQEIDAAIDRILKASGSALRHYTMALNLERMRGEMREILASRLSSIKPGEEVVNSEEYAALLDFAGRIVPIRDNLSGISWVGNLKDVFAAYDNWYAIRIAQGTPTEKVGNV